MLLHGRGFEVDFLGGWTFDPSTVALIAAVGLLYALGSRRLRGAARPSAWQQLAFFGGLLVAFLALTSPIARLTDDLFAAHMTQHTLLTSVAVPLALLGFPLRPLLAAIPRTLRRGPVRAIAGWSPARRTAHLLTHPLVAAGLYIVVTLAWHAPPAYAAAVESEPLHAAQHFSFVATAVLFWMQVIDPLPFHSLLGLPVRLLYVVAAGFPHHLLTSTILILSPRPLYEIYAGRAPSLGFTALADQQLAGGIMALGSFLSSLVAFTALFFLWLDREERDQRMREKTGRALAAARRTVP